MRLPTWTCIFATRVSIEDTLVDSAEYAKAHVMYTGKRQRAAADHGGMGRQALDAGTAAVLPEGLRTELEQLEDNGGVRHLHDLVAQIKARPAQAPM